MTHILEWQETTNPTRGTVLPVDLKQYNNKNNERRYRHIYVCTFFLK